MADRVEWGAYTGQPVAVVRERGDRVEVFGLVPWFGRNVLNHLGLYWEGGFAPHANPRTVIEGIGR